MTNPHWRARLLEIQDLLIVAHTADAVAKAVLQLTSVLCDEWASVESGSALSVEAHNEIVLLRSLVRDASRILSRILNDTVDLGWGSEVHDWQRSAAPFVGE
jgi:hypothetical protein